MAVIEAIETVYLEADATSVTFSGIPTTYEHLQLRLSCRSDRADMHDVLLLQFNSDTGTGATTYSSHWLDGTSSSATAGTSANSYFFIGWPVPASQRVAAQYGPMDIDILDYRNTNKNTTVMGTAGRGDGGRVEFGSMVWDSTAAVTSIVLDIAYGTNFVRGSEFTLYGLKSS
jgi:hypothetical protein